MKNILVFIAIIFTFLLLPKENRWFIFHASEESFYGEIDMRGGNEEYIIAKNSSNSTVYMPKIFIKSSISKQIENDHYFITDSLSAVFPNSFTIIQVDPGNGNLSMERNYNNKYRFTALPLEVLTDAEKQYQIIIYILFTLITGVLVYFVTSFSIKSNQSFTYE